MELPGPTGVSGELLVVIFKNFFETVNNFKGMPTIRCFVWSVLEWLWWVGCTYEPESLWYQMLWIHYYVMTWIWFMDAKGLSFADLYTGMEQLPDTIPNG